MGALAKGGRLLPVQLRRERPLADRRRVRLHHADDARDPSRWDPCPDRRTAGERVGARHVRIDAPVEIAHRAELPLEQDARVPSERRLDEWERVDDSVAKSRGGGEYAVRDRAGVERRVAEALEDGVLGLELALHALAKSAFVFHLVDLDPMPPDLVRVRRPDPHPGGAEHLAAPLPLVETIERDVPRQEEMRAVGHAEVRRRDAASLELLELLAEEREVDDGPRTEHAERARIEDAARHEVELEGAVLVDDGVSGVVAALEPDDQVRLLRQEVRDLAFAFVAPLSPDDGRHRHVVGC